MKSFFNSEADRELWIKLDAERQIEWEKSLTYFDKESETYKPTLQALHPRSIEEALRIAKIAIAYDEKHGKLRFTLEELLTLDREQLTAIRQDQTKKFIARFL